MGVSIWTGMNYGTNCYWGFDSYSTSGINKEIVKLYSGSIVCTGATKCKFPHIGGFETKGPYFTTLAHIVPILLVYTVQLKMIVPENK